MKPSVCRMMHFCTRLSCKVFPPRFALIRFPSNNSKRQKEERTKVPKMHRLLIFPASHPRRGKSRNWEKLETQTAAIRFKPVKVSAKFRLWQMMIVWPSRFFKNFIFLTFTFGRGRTNCANLFFAYEMELKIKCQFKKSD